MAITNAQQYQQLVNPPMKGNKRPGYRGEAAAASDAAAGRSAGRDTSPAGTGNVGGDFDRGSFQAAQRRGEIRNLIEQQEIEKARGIDPETGLSRANLESIQSVGVGRSDLPGVLGIGLNATLPFRRFTLEKNKEYFTGLKSRGAAKNYPPTAQGYKDYMSDRLAGKIDAAGNPIMSGDDDDNNIILPVDTTFAQAPSTEEQEPEVEEPFQLSRRFRAEGGIMNSDVVGG